MTTGAMAPDRRSAAMKPRETLSGAEAERARRRKWWTLLGAALAAGFATGIGVGLTQEGGPFAGGRIPEWLAIAAVALYLVTMIAGTVLMKRFTDEVEMHNNLFGLAVGASALMLVYPPWLLLWRGGLVPEPGHEPLFLVTIVPAVIAYLWKKYR